MLDFLSNNILTRAFWGDEAWTAVISQLPVVDLIKTTAADFHPPLYYLIVHYWINIFGNSEISIRSISLIFWLLAGLAAYFLGRSLKLDRLWSAFFLLFTLFNPFIFAYAFEARNYTLFIFLSIVSAWQFYEIIKGKGNNFLYLIPSVLGMYTHYYMFFIIGAQYLFVLLTRRDLIKRFILLGVGFVIAYIPWLPFFLAQTKSVASGYWIPPVTYETVRDTAKVLVRGEQGSQFYDQLPTWYVFFMLVGAGVALVKKRLFTKETLLFTLWFLVPFFAPVILSYVRPIFFYRYLIVTAVPLMLLPLWWFGVKKHPLLLVFPLVFLAIFLHTDWLSFTTETNQIFRPVLKTVKETPHPIYTRLPSFAEVVYYNNYSGEPLPVMVIPEGLQQASGKALLDTYVSKGLIKLENPPEDQTYWLLEPGPTYEIKN